MEINLYLILLNFFIEKEGKTEAKSEEKKEKKNKKVKGKEKMVKY